MVKVRPIFQRSSRLLLAGAAALALAGTLAFAQPALSQPQPAVGASMPGLAGKPAQPQRQSPEERLAEQLRQSLEVNDEEWRVLGPKIERIVMLQRQRDRFSKPAPGGKGKRVLLAMDQVPAAARDALKGVIGDIKQDEVTKETRKEGEVYTAKWLVKDQAREAKVLADGTLLESKKVVPAGEVPAEIKRAIESALPQVSNIEYQEKTAIKDGQSETVYEVRAEVNGERQNLRVMPDGSIDRRGPGGRDGPGAPPKPPKADATDPAMGPPIDDGKGKDRGNGIPGIDIRPDAKMDSLPGTPNAEMAEQFAQLAALASDKNARLEEMKSTLVRFRAAQTKSAEELAKAREELRELVTVKQEVVLVVMGILD